MMLQPTHRQDGHCAAQVLGVLEELLALLEGLKHQLELTHVQVEHRLF